MSVDVSKIPNSRNFDSVREAILELDDSISDTGASINNTQITITAGSNMTGGGVFTLNQSNISTITLNADDQSLTDAQVKTAYENNADTNAFTDAEKTKIGNITSTGSGDIITTTERNKLSNIEDNATSDQTANEILTLVKTVDGTGSGLDADLLDGEEGSYYLDYSNFRGNYTLDYDSSGNKRVYGILYYVGNETNINDAATTTGTFDFTTNTLNLGINGEQFSEFPPDSASSTNTVFVLKWSSTNTGGTGETARPVSGLGTLISSTQFSGPVTFRALESADSTIIDGSNITTGSIRSVGFSAGTDGFSTQGTRINLADGSVEAENFRINSTGDAKFTGELSTENVFIDNDQIEVKSFSNTNLGIIKFTDENGSESSHIQNVTGTGITEPIFRIRSTDGQVLVKGESTSLGDGRTDFIEAVRVESTNDIGIVGRSILLGNKLMYTVEGTINASSTKNLVSFNNTSGLSNRTFVVYINISMDQHSRYVVYNAKTDSIGSFSISNRVSQGSSQIVPGNTSNVIRFSNNTLTNSLPFVAEVNIVGSSASMTYDLLDDFLSFTEITRGT
tara:strand:+ start:90 stop:1787 length:1698 start_codon:yes stop_codon:yes gene_type:complete